MFPDDLLQEPAVLHKLFIHTLDILNSKDSTVVLIIWMLPAIVLIEVNLCKNLNEILLCVFVPTKQFRIKM